MFVWFVVTADADIQQVIVETCATTEAEHVCDPPSFSQPLTRPFTVQMSFFLFILDQLEIAHSTWVLYGCLFSNCHACVCVLYGAFDLFKSFI